MLSIPFASHCRTACCLLAVALLGVFGPARAADADFVGIVALAADPAVATELKLSDETKQKLKDLILKREDEVTGLALKLSKLPPMERLEQMKPFVVESERLGLAILTAEQRAQLEQIHLSKLGTAALLRPAVAEQIKLTAEQQQRLAALAAEMEEKTAGKAESERRIVEVGYQRQMKGLLDNDQVAAWDKMIGRIQGATEVATAQDLPGEGEEPAKPETKPEPKPAEEEPKPEKPADDPKEPAKEPTEKPADEPMKEPAEKPEETKPETKPEPPRFGPGNSGSGSSGRPPYGSGRSFGDRGSGSSGSSRGPGGSSSGSSGSGSSGTGPVSPLPTTKPSTSKPKEVIPPGGKSELGFNFTFAPWKSVLEWFAEQADLSLVMENAPPGTFNYTDNRRKYTPDEALDLINSVLLTKGYTLQRRDRMLMLFNLEDGPVKPDWLEQLTPDQLAGRGKFEVVSCLFTISKMAPEDAESEIRKLLGPQGFLQVLPKSKQVYVTETVGKLRLIQRAIEAVENPAILEKDENITSVPLKHTTPQEFLALAKPLMGIPENLNSAPDGSIRIAVDELGGRLLVTGKPERITKLQELVKLIDVEQEIDFVPAAGPLEQPQLETFTITGADPVLVHQVMSTLLEGEPGVRMSLDQTNGKLVVLAGAQNLAKIRATLDQLQRDGKKAVVIKLRTVDPSTALLAITKLFGEKGPVVDADPTSMQLFIRGNPEQVEEIRGLLKDMGELDWTDEKVLAERKHQRVIPGSNRALDAALGQAQILWGTGNRENKIRVRTPTKLPDAPDIEQRRTPANETRLPLKPMTPPVAEPKRQPAPAASDREASVRRGPRVVFVSELNQKQPAPPVVDPFSDDADLPAKQPAKKEESKEEESKEASVPGADIEVIYGPGGIIIASKDLDALDEFESLLKELMAQTATSGGREYTIFYLKFCKADGAADLLREAMGVAAANEDGGGGGGGLFGNLAQGVLGDSGGLFGALLGGGAGGGPSSSSSSSSGTVTIIPDLRLNALLVHASDRDLDTMEQLLKVIDQPSSPEDVQTVARPRLIPVLHTDAQTVADVLRQVYAGRMQAEAGGGQQRQPSPEEFIRALRGGGRGQQQQRKSEEQKVTIGVDSRSNSLIVSAPEYLFGEINDLVKKLDSETVPNNDTVRVVNLKRANSDQVQRTISAVLGDQVEIAASATTPAAAPRPGGMGAAGARQGQGGNRNQGQGNQGGGNQGAFNQQIFQELQRAANQGGGGGGRGGGGFGGGGGGRGGR